MLGVLAVASLIDYNDLMSPRGATEVLPLHKKIYAKYQLVPASHMTHIDNLRCIISAGGLRSKSSLGHECRSIANDDVQSGRSRIVVPASKRPLHDYVPLYFGFKTPMVACNQQINEDLIFLRFSLDILSKPGVVITDGNARVLSSIDEWH